MAQKQTIAKKIDPQQKKLKWFTNNNNEKTPHAKFQKQI